MNTSAVVKAQSLSREKERLETMEDWLGEYVRTLRTEKDMLHDFFTAAISSSWQSGKAKEAFIRAAEEYVEHFTRKIQRLEDLQVEIIRTRIRINWLHKQAVAQSVIDIF